MYSKGLVFVVVGATSGIARKLIPMLAENAVVIPIARHDSPNLAAHRDEIPSLVGIDLYGDDFVEIESRISAGDRICFINFSTATCDQLFVKLRLEDFRESFEVNVLSSVKLLQKLIRMMILRGWGRIIFVSSTRGARGDVGISSYSCAKSSLAGLSGSIAREYARFGITSNVLSLGYFESPLLNSIGLERRRSLIEAIPSRTLGASNDIESAIKMIVDCSYFNARQINVDGGAD
jgi:NAD(P)-dependent dehydrogenase (short-subunit alcohol dehydrogenase family)